VQYEFQGKLESWQPDAVLDCTRDALSITLGYDIAGHDLAIGNFVHIKTRVVKLEACVHECWFNEKCLGFSYDLDKTECWLKDAAAAPALPKAGIVSGVVKQSARKKLTEQLKSEYPDKRLREAFFKLKCERHATNSSTLNMSPSDCEGLRIEGVGENVDNIYIYIYIYVYIYKSKSPFIISICAPGKSFFHPVSFIGLLLYANPCQCSLSVLGATSFA
jgi:hypothetical protein